MYNQTNGEIEHNQTNVKLDIQIGRGKQTEQNKNKTKRDNRPQTEMRRRIR